MSETIQHKTKSHVSVKSLVKTGPEGRKTGVTVKQFHASYPDLSANIIREVGNLRMAMNAGVNCVRYKCHDKASITLDYLDARELQDVLENETCGATKTALISSAIKALQKLHSIGIVHGDTHPSNFLVDRDGTVFICDFGLSHSLKFPFTAIPPTQPKEGYFTDEQNEALASDIKTLKSSFHNVFRTNSLSFRSDVVMLGMHLSNIKGIPTDCIHVLERMAAGEFDSCDLVILELEGTPPPIFNIKSLIRMVTPDPIFPKIPKEIKFPKTLSTLSAKASQLLDSCETERTFDSESWGQRMLPLVIITICLVGLGLFINDHRKTFSSWGNSLSVRNSDHSKELSPSVPVTQAQNSAPLPAVHQEPTAPVKSERELRFEEIDVFRKGVLAGDRNACRQLFALKSAQDSAVAARSTAIVNELFASAKSFSGSETGRQILGIMAENGFHPAFTALGEIYEKGTGLSERNLVTAYGKYLQAAQLGSAEAAAARQRLENFVPVLLKDPACQKEGFRLLLAAAEQRGNVNAQFNAGRIYEDGVYGVRKNLVKARTYLAMAAEIGHAQAITSLERVKRTLRKKVEVAAAKSMQDEQTSVVAETTKSASDLVNAAVWK